MLLDQKAIIKQIDDVLAKSEVRSPNQYRDLSDVPAERLTEAISLLYGAIQRLAPRGSWKPLHCEFAASVWDRGR